ncbi:uncharacterized protein C17orf50 homolog isoform X1 [Aphelocoma coerulescens]|uniref:uncharacterized protein C17orf50 homolog isoform X1 n=1 Tax=Aphelocoma coerulescens TaxID=39617 RepID=UPI003604D1DF
MGSTAEKSETGCLRRDFLDCASSLALLRLNCDHTQAPTPSVSQVQPVEEFINPTLIASAALIHLGSARAELVTSLCDCSSPQGRSQLSEDKRRCLHRKGSKRLKPAREEMCSLRQPHSGKMCPKCEILLCRKCGTLHSQSGFIAHSLLDHYDTGGVAALLW